MMTTPKRQIIPTTDTKFHIDYSWWDSQQHELQVYLMSLLPVEKRQYLEAQAELDEIDIIDPETGAIHRLNPFEQAIKASSSDIDLTKTSLVDAVFRVFLLNNNSPLSPVELSKIVGRPPETILRTIGTTTRIYRGLRPVFNDN